MLYSYRLNAPVRGTKSCNESIVSGLSDSTRSTTGKGKCTTIRRGASTRTAQSRSANSTPTRSNAHKRIGGLKSSKGNRGNYRNVQSDRCTKKNDGGHTSKTNSSQALVALESNQGNQTGLELTLYQKQCAKSSQLCYGGRITPQRLNRTEHNSKTKMFDSSRRSGTVQKFKKSVINSSTVSNPSIHGTPNRRLLSSKPPLPPRTVGNGTPYSRSATSTPLRPSGRRERFSRSVPSSPVSVCTFGSGRM